MKRYVLAFVLFAGCASQNSTTNQSPVLQNNLRNHVSYLSSDALEGRRAGTDGEKLAAAYISNQFEQLGLTPKGTDGFLQPFEVSSRKVLSSESFVEINNDKLQSGKDFFVLPYSADGRLNALASVALMESGEPWFFNMADWAKQQANNPHFNWQQAVYDKAREVAGKKASALVLFDLSPEINISFLEADKLDVLSIPVIYISKQVAKKHFSDPSALIDISLNLQRVTEKRIGNNVIGFVDNGAASTIVLGAHYDHLGFGEDKNSRHTGSDLQIHNGADDNASGTAALIELARMVKSSGLKNHNFLFIAFSGEELGLYGSKHFLKQPTIDTASINFMINMDMIGRLNDSSKTLTVGGYGTSPTWGQLYATTGKKALYPAASYRFDSSGTGPSDHSSFYMRNIPVLFYFTGLHTDYHKPSDDFDKINYKGQSDIVLHIFSLLKAADAMNTKLLFTKTREMQTTTTARFSVTMGIMPDYTFNGKGVRVDGVSDGRPAQKAGLQTGDVIVSVGSNAIHSVEDYMQALSKFKKGDSTSVKYQRGDKQLQSTIVF